VVLDENQYELRVSIVSVLVWPAAMSLLPLELERVLVSVLVDRLKIVVLYADSQDHEQPEERVQVSDQVEVRVPYRESSVGRQRCCRYCQSIQIIRFNPSAWI
jgi:hypothetical protein